MTETAQEKIVRLKRKHRVEIKVDELARVFTLGLGGAVTIEGTRCPDETEGLAPDPRSKVKLFAVVMDRGPEGVIALFDEDPDQPGDGMASAMQRATSAVTPPESPATSQGQEAAKAAGASTSANPSSAAAATSAEPVTRPDVPHPGTTATAEGDAKKP